jgi:group I intron endonuclease
MGVIYKITSPTGRIYVGKTKRVKTRIWEYRWRSKKRTSIIHMSIKKYGWFAHKFEIIEEVENEKLNEREIFWIKELNTYHQENPDGMNMTTGGDGNPGSWMHDLERRKKQSERFSGKGGTFYGKHHTDENKRIIAEKSKAYALKHQLNVPKWGAEKGRKKVIKPVVCYDKNGDFVGEYESATRAAKELIISRTGIVENLSGGNSGVDGKYVFRYKAENYPLKIEVGEIQGKEVAKRVIFKEGNKEKIFEKAEDASKYTGVPTTTIRRACAYNNGKPIRSGHIFYYL